jgi:hypothetical protein
VRRHAPPVYPVNHHAVKPLLVPYTDNTDNHFELSLHMFRSLFRVHGNLNRLNRTTQTSSFHTTTPTPINPLVGILARFGARFAGRQLKTKYDALPLAERKRLKRYVKGDEGANALHATGVAFALCGVGWYVAHLETNPVTGRTRYLTATRADIAALALEQTIELVEEYEAAQLLYKPNHRTYKQVQEITNNLIAALEYLPELKQLVDEQEEFIDWELHVVKSEQQNAFVLPTGYVAYYDCSCCNDHYLVLFVVSCACVLWIVSCGLCPVRVSRACVLCVCPVLVSLSCSLLSSLLL